MEVVTRDRSAVYAHAVTEAVPAVVQIADRWHLLKNLSENLERYLDTQRTLLKEVAQELNQKPGEVSSQLPLIDQKVRMPERSKGNSVGRASIVPLIESTEKRYPHYQQVKFLQQQGYGRKTIARHLGLSRNTVRKYFAQSSFVAKVHSRRSNWT